MKRVKFVKGNRTELNGNTCISQVPGTRRPVFVSVLVCSSPPGSRVVRFGTARSGLIVLKGWRRGTESNRRIKVLQTFALPLGYRARLIKVSFQFTGLDYSTSRDHRQQNVRWVLAAVMDGLLCDANFGLSGR